MDREKGRSIYAELGVETLKDGTGVDDAVERMYKVEVGSGRTCKPM